MQYDFKIISTGSKGNAIILNKNVCIDMGVSFTAVRPYYKDLSLVLLTHEHGDHFLPSTVRRVALERPALRWGCCSWMVPFLLECGVDKRKIDVYTTHTGIYYGDSFPVSIEPFPLPHNVPNCGYKIHFQDYKVFYATDTNRLDHIEASNYDLYFVEATENE